MNTRILHGGVLALLAGLSWSGLLEAEEHAEEALRHAEQAARSSGDSAAIREHADAALNHLEAAKTTKHANPKALQHLDHGETDLNDAVLHARRFNSQSAADEAGDASRHLELAQQPAEVNHDR